MTSRDGTGRPALVLAVVVTAVFMVTLDNLVVTTALASISEVLGASLGELEWVVNSYTVTFAACMLLASAVADRFGHRRVFALGLLLFTGSSAMAAMSPTIGLLIAARTVQGIGAAAVLPLGLTLLAGAFPPARRGLALGIWSGVSGLGVALGPLVGGLAVQAGSWQAIFWLNVPVGVGLLAVIRAALPAAPAGRTIPMDLPGAVLITAALVGLLVALAGLHHAGWFSIPVLAPLIGAGGLVLAFIRWQRRATVPLLPGALIRSAALAPVHAVNATMYFGMFGSIFLLAPFLQTVLGDSPLQAGVRILPWTVMPLLISPLVGLVIDIVGPRLLVVGGMALQAAALGWLAAGIGPDLTGPALVGPCLLGGVGMSLVYPPIAAALLAGVREEQVNRASAVMNSLREIAGAIGIAAVAAVFVAGGGGPQPDAYVAGLRPALWVATVVLVAGAAAACRLPGPTRPADRATVAGAAPAAHHTGVRGPSEPEF
jgi:EmrB/QacA subfamily drug resistance transporter